MMQFPVTFISQFFKISVNCLATGDINKEKFPFNEYDLQKLTLNGLLFRNSDPNSMTVRQHV